MQYFRVTKYDPKKRDDNDLYLDQEEWTSPGQVPNDEYLVVEAKYIDAAKAFFE